MRYLETDLRQTIEKEKKMAFVAGPRQVGKTTLAQALLKEKETLSRYFNWDVVKDRQRILHEPDDFWRSSDAADPVSPSRVVLDEIHKYPRWKRFLKGFFDAHRGEVEVIVTGSGRLDIYQKGGDSLFGRYHLFHLLPFSVGEMVHSEGRDLSPIACSNRIFENTLSGAGEGLDQLWRFSGFPEPLFAANQRQLTRWQNDHQQLILREDLRDLTQIREIGLIEMLISLLPERIGSPLSINGLCEDLGVNFKTVQNWIKTLDRLYYLFPLRPYAGRLARTLRREEKVYFYDWAELEDEGDRFENMLAVHLLKACHYWTDAGYGRFDLYYVRDKEKRETDFLVTEKNKPFWLVEAKLSTNEMDPSLSYFQERLKVPRAFQVVKNASPEMFSSRGKEIYLCSAARFLAALP